MASSKKGKTALVLASGGIAGVAYEVGALRALDHILTNRTVNDFDIYVGTSAGAVVASAMASGVPPVLLAGLIAGSIPGFTRLGRLQLYRPNFGEVVQRLTKAPGILREAAAEYWRFRDRIPVSEALMHLTPLLPSGIFTNDGVEEYIRQTFSVAGLSDDFRDIPKELHIVAADIENDKRVDFSRFTFPDVPISKAVAASTCIPIMFRPVEIEGRHYVDGGIKGHAAVDVAIARGAKLIVVVNALVPLDTRAMNSRRPTPGGSSTIFDLGIRAIGNQVLRGMLHDSLVDHLRAVREKHPDVDIVLIEPQPDDEKMFFHEVMSFSAQLIVLQHGYESVVSGLYRSWPYLSKILPSHGIEVTRKVVDRKPLDIPIDQIRNQRNIVGWLRETVLDRRSDNQGAASEVVATPARVASRRRQTGATAKPPSTKKPAARTATVAARRRGTFRPRVISSEG